MDEDELAEAHKQSLATHAPYDTFGREAAQKAQAAAREGAAGAIPGLALAGWVEPVPDSIGMVAESRCAAKLMGGAEQAGLQAPIGWSEQHPRLSCVPPARGRHPDSHHMDCSCRGTATKTGSDEESMQLLDVRRAHAPWPPCRAACTAKATAARARRAAGRGSCMHR